MGVPDGTWDYRDPGRLVLERVGHPDPDRPHTVLAEVGVLQHQLWHRAARLISDGDLDVALVVGGEARHRSGCAARAGLDLPDTAQTADVAPDQRLTTDDVGISTMELERGLHQPASAYALMESAISHASGRTPGEHRDEVASLWARFARIAAGNPHAWNRDRPSARTIADVSATNRMISQPYTKLMCSQWNVNQAAALLLCSVDAARRAGIPTEQWVFPHVITENRRSEPVSERRHLDRLPGARVASRRLLDIAGVTTDDIALFDLYSCFPASVQISAVELGVALDRDLTVTGGLTFGGGPFNNYIVGSTAEMANRLRAEPGEFGLVTNVSAFLSKQGYDLWSTMPPRQGYRYEDCTDAVAAQLDLATPTTDRTGHAEIVAWTVEHAAGEPWQVLAVGSFPDGSRTLATSQDRDVLEQMSTGDWVGRSVTVAADGALRL